MHDALVLIVDDKPEVRAIVARQLRRGGIRSEAIGTAREALDRVARGDIALVIVDVALSHPKEGLELADGIHGLDPEIIVMFFTGDEHSVAEYPHLELIKKPHSERGIVRAVRAELMKNCTHRLVKKTHDLLKTHIEDKIAHHPPSVVAGFTEDVKHPGVRALLAVLGSVLLIVGAVGLVALKGLIK